MLTALGEQLVNGAMMGTIYVLVALGMVLIYGVMHVLNFAHGVLFTAGAYVCLLVFTRLLGNYWLALGASMLVLAAVGLLLELLVFRRLRGSVQMQIVASLGLILVIQNGIVAAFGPSGLQMRVPTVDTLVRLGPLSFTLQHVLILGIVAVSVTLLFLFLHRTRLGTALRATSQHPEAARVVGINPDRIYLLTFAIASALAALGGALLGPLFLIFPQMGDLPLLKALAAIVLGGMASVPGAIVGGLAIGIVEAVSTLFIPTDYRDTVVFALLVIVLLLRPWGLFGVRVRGEA
ncbi:branched-chain amino acid ABC transporter permease [Roseomonas sp. BN140053]|uniref:branched-chain amino acid ABC transporter permease n=1 Tax=Roseomonas sp. BN140053 TaxID=3391898 RepID=UPI0039EB2ED7